MVLHPGSAKTGDVSEAIARAGATIREALAESEGCPLHLENTAGGGGTLGRSVEELAALIDAAGGGERLGVCLDSCHLFASGYDVRTPAGMDALLEEVSAKVGLERLGSLHLNDSQGALGSCRDRHANLGQGELGERGCAAFLAAAPFEDLPCVLETRAGRPRRPHRGGGRAGDGPTQAGFAGAAQTARLEGALARKVGGPSIRDRRTPSLLAASRRPSAVQLPSDPLISEQKPLHCGSDDGAPMALVGVGVYPDAVLQACLHLG